MNRLIQGVETKKLSPIPSQIEQIRYIYEVYAQESVSLRRLLDILVAEGKKPLDGSDWSTAKLSTLLKNPIYVRADSDIWLKCQKKLSKNKQINNSYSNSTSWLAGKVVCEKCGHNMTTVKGVINKAGDIRRYFNCTGKSHQKICTGTRITIYAEDLENMVNDCISEKLTELKSVKHNSKSSDYTEINDLKLKLKAVEQKEKQLLDTMLKVGFNKDLLALANQKATQLKQDKLALRDRIEELKNRSEETAEIVNLGRSWKNADYGRKKEVADILIDKIFIVEDGSTKVVWNI